MSDSNRPVRVHVLDTGFCLASEHHLMRGAPRRKIHCHSLVALLHHPDHGWLLWDTGYAPRMFDVTARLPFRLYRWATPLVIAPELSVAAQLSRFGLTADDVKTVFLSHFHADHLCGVLDFPKATFVTTAAAYESIRTKVGWGALKRAFIPALLPGDFESRLKLLEPFAGETLADFGPTHDWLGDGSIRLVDLPGHARGQFGILVRSERGPLFFAADGAWHSEAIRDNRPPHWLTHFVVDNVSGVRATLERLHRFALERPDVTMIPTHCPEVFRRFVGAEP